MALTKTQRAELRMKFGGRCAYCGCELPEKGWHADHVEPIYRGRDFNRTITDDGRLEFQSRVAERAALDVSENLNPACKQCNLFKGGHTLEGFREQIAHQAERARAYSVNFRTAERFGLIEVIEKPVIFWFEQYNGEAPQGA
ncbi:HNH endonuclease [Lelliottia wanjuensis]|uniref:HNH endonuclease signature motif containing protein n=1 Tax=Lelliottia wanjuensis TaxID=3050585 RepID=A0AAP4FX97_9ENTR|nr:MULTISPECIES: HNH endonuclease signature motif containing protein [unclassified Lelliottia]MDK9365360.1 HNH endonuclease signature motif containing protein [Lelliottia sp. V106_12]MDK9617893.1 HNH endonuclease signature motif containing protein [Lelliottia sp. V106_9]